MKYILFPHGGSGNHGCEAIVRTTANILNKEELHLYSTNVEEDNKYMGREILKIHGPTRQIVPFSLRYMKAQIRKYILRNEKAFDELSFSPVIEACDNKTVLLSIGGDNYCYGDNYYIYLVNRCAKKRGSRTVLWGCSVEPEAITSDMRQDLQSYDMIIARESLTYHAMQKINRNTYLFPDPAFCLPKQDGTFPEDILKKKIIGINVSPMVQGMESRDGIIMENYRNLLRDILSKTDRGIALIPHVVWQSNDDRIPLTELYKEFCETGRVFLIEDQNCMCLKDIISRCEFFVGARTHATIAAYSTAVPTLVVGYSIKAKGIARDIFGTEEGYVLPTQQLKTEKDLADGFWKLYNKKESIHQQLTEFMPQYIRQLEGLGEVLNRLW